MDKDKIELMHSSHKVYSLGLEVENARADLRHLVDCGTPYNSPEMLAALEQYEKLDAEWKQLEAEHLTLIRTLKNPPGNKLGLFNS